MASLVPAGTSDATDGPRPPGTGPYVVGTPDSEGVFRLTRNPEFHSWSAGDRPDGFADSVLFRPPSATGDRIAAVERGSADLAYVDNGGAPFSADRLRGLLTRYPSRVTSTPELGGYFLFLNVHEPPFDDVRVRRAVNLATDRRRMVALTGGTERSVPSCGVVPASIPNARPFCPYTAAPTAAGTWTDPDLATARRLVAESGTRGTPVTFWTSTDKVRYARYFVGLLRRLGYPARFRALDARTKYWPTIGDSRTHAQIGMSGYLADYASPATFFSAGFSCAALRPASRTNPNFSQLCDPGLDRLAARATAADGSDAARAWSVAERRLAAIAPAVPLVTRRNLVFTSERAGNVRQHPLLGVLYEQMWVR
jgi:peptide/nickel transport system substrate-binding protein